LRAERSEESRLSNHPAETGADNYEVENTACLLETEGQMLADIDHALELIEKGAYGRCESCGKRIPLKRLKAIPWARLCVACANASEQNKSTSMRTTRRVRRYAW